MNKKEFIPATIIFVLLVAYEAWAFYLVAFASPFKLIFKMGIGVCCVFLIYCTANVYLKRLKELKRSDRDDSRNY